MIEEMKGMREKEGAGYEEEECRGEELQRKRGVKKERGDLRDQVLLGEARREEIARYVWI